MVLQIKYALIMAGVAILMSLVYISLPAMGETPKPASGEYTAATLGDVPIRLQLADTPAERVQGLSGRDGLAEDEGLLFIFEEDGHHAFWMKDMRFSIDILWLKADGEVVDIASNVAPETYPQSFAPSIPARYVLELPAGFAERYTIEVGDMLVL